MKGGQEEREVPLRMVLVARGVRDNVKDVLPCVLHQGRCVRRDRLGLEVCVYSSTDVKISPKQHSTVCTSQVQKRKSIPAHLLEAIARRGEQHAHAPGERLPRGDVARAVDEPRAVALHDVDRSLHATDHDRRAEALPEREDRPVLLCPLLELTVRAIQGYKRHYMQTRRLRRTMQAGGCSQGCPVAGWAGAGRLRVS